MKIKRSFLVLFFFGFLMLGFSMPTLADWYYCETKSVDGYIACLPQGDAGCQGTKGSAEVECWQWCDATHCEACNDVRYTTKTIVKKSCVMLAGNCSLSGTVGLCSGGGSGTPKACEQCGCCTANVNVTTCPVGTTDVDNGNPVLGQAGTTTVGPGCAAANPNACRVRRDLYNCYSINEPPTLVDVNMSGISVNSSYGCLANSSYIGQQANNRLNIDATFTDTGCSVRDCRNMTNVIRAIQVWIAPTQPNPADYKYILTTNNLGYKQQAQAPSLSSFGLLIRKNANTEAWNLIYVPGKRLRTGIKEWVGSVSMPIGSGHRIDIKAPGSYVSPFVEKKKMVGVSDVFVTDDGPNTDVTLTLEFYNDESGLELSTYEKVLDGTYKIFLSASDIEMFPEEETDLFEEITEFAPYIDTDNTKTIDLTDPIVDSLSSTVAGPTSVDISWSVSDATSNIVRVLGDAQIGDGGITNGTIDDITSGVSNYVLGSGNTGTDLFVNGPHLWSVDGVTKTLSRTENIDLKSNIGQPVDYLLNPFDAACNNSNPVVTAVSTGSSWITTKGGLTYSDSGVSITVPLSAVHQTISADTYWGTPFSFYKDEVDYSTEILMSKASSLPSLVHSASMRGVRLLNNSDLNNKNGYWFDTLSQRSNEKIVSNPTEFTVITHDSDATVTTSSTTAGCLTPATKNCVIKVGGNLTVNSGFSCNARTMFLVSGTTTINPDITASSGEYGCIFVSKGDVTIGAGTYKTGAALYPKYDIVQSFILSDSQIKIPSADGSQTIPDGMKIDGSLVAFGTVGTSSIVVSRKFNDTLSTDYPSLAVHFDNRYLNISSKFFGGDNEGFKREVGFKPL